MEDATEFNKKWLANIERKMSAMDAKIVVVAGVTYTGKCLVATSKDLSILDVKDIFDGVMADLVRRADIKSKSDIN